MTVTIITGLVPLDQDELGPLREIYETFETQSAGRFRKLRRLFQRANQPIKVDAVIHCKTKAYKHFAAALFSNL